MNSPIDAPTPPQPQRQIKRVCLDLSAQGDAAELPTADAVDKNKNFAPRITSPSPLNLTPSSSDSSTASTLPKNEFEEIQKMINRQGSKHQAAMQMLAKSLGVDDVDTEAADTLLPIEKNEDLRNLEKIIVQNKSIRRKLVNLFGILKIHTHLFYYFYFIFLKINLRRTWLPDSKRADTLRMIINEEVLAKFNWDGRHGKMPLKNYLLFKDVLFGKIKHFQYKYYKIY